MIQLIVTITIYLLYQWLRTKEVHSIQIKWIRDSSPKRYKYPYDYMFIPSAHNWFGLKYPKDEMYK